MVEAAVLRVVFSAGLGIITVSDGCLEDLRGIEARIRNSRGLAMHPYRTNLRLRIALAIHPISHPRPLTLVESEQRAIPLGAQRAFLRFVSDTVAVDHGPG